MADPRLKMPKEDPVYAAGQSARAGIGNYGEGQRSAIKAAGETVVKPFVNATRAATPFVQGLYGIKPDGAESAAAPAAPAKPKLASGAPTSTLAEAPPNRPAAAAPAGPTLLPAVTVRPSAPPEGVSRSRDANGTPVYSNAPGTGAIPAATGPTLQAPAPVIAQPSNALAVQEATQRVVAGQRSAAMDTRADAARLLNPMGNEGELLRRAEIAASTMRGSPSSRAAVVNALLGQIGAQNDASAAGQRTANEALLQGARGEGFADEAASRRDLDASQFNVEAGQRSGEFASELAADQRRPTGSTLRGLDGVTSVLRNDGTATPIVDPDGKPVLTATPAQPGEITPQDLLESYNTQAKAIAEGVSTPIEKQQQMDALRQDPTYSNIFNQGERRVGNSPYPEGARLVRDGKRYVVQNGQPVLEQ